jgi:asparagine synthase (glutamine-hydrolysing)
MRKGSTADRAKPAQVELTSRGFQPIKDLFAQRAHALLMSLQDESELRSYSSPLRALLDQATADAKADGILLSGGLDTSVVSYSATRGSRLSAATVAFTKGEPSDPPYANKVAAFLGIEHFFHEFDLEEFTDASHHVIEVLRTFDPVEVRNSASIYLAIRLAKDHGMRRVLTGDAFDEIYAGYSFFVDMTDYEVLQKALEAMWAVMSFTSKDLGRSMGIDVEIPALHPDFFQFSKGVPAQLKVKDVNGKRWGKWIVRAAYRGLLPDDILWRPKAPIEAGTGTTYAEVLADEAISDDEFANEKERLIRSGLALRNKEQLGCYRFYVSKFGDKPAYADLVKKCRCCGSGMEQGKNYCRVCGAYPA